MTEQHIRWSPTSCTCVLDLLLDTVTGDQTLFCIRNLCDVHRVIATPDPDFQTKKAATLAARYQQLDDNLTANYAQIDAYTDLQMSPTDKAACKATIARITAERKAEYDLLLTQSDLVFCVNVNDTVKEESSRWPKIYTRVQSQFSFTDEQMRTITYSFTGTAPNRNITVNFGSLLTTNQKNATQTWCNTNVGIGKVTII